jgi:hypothetical protein
MLSGVLNREQNARSTDEKDRLTFGDLGRRISVRSGSAGNFETAGPKNWGAGSASQPALKSAAAGHLVGYRGVFKLTVISSTSPATCPDGYAHQCASGNCQCVEFSGTGSGSRFGKSTNVSAEITVDLDNQPGDPDGTCFPAFGFLAFDGSKDANEVVDFVGAACNNISGSSTFNGGFEFDDVSSTLFDAQGPVAYGKFLKSGVFLFKLRGKACVGTAPCS